MVNANRVANERSKLLVNSVHHPTPAPKAAKATEPVPHATHTARTTFNHGTSYTPTATHHEDAESEGSHEGEPEPRLTWKRAGWQCFIGQRLIFAQDLISLSLTVAFCAALLMVYFIGVCVPTLIVVAVVGVG